MSTQEKVNDNVEKTNNKQDNSLKNCQKLLDQKVNTENFISEIEKHPSIWDCNSNEYSNKHIKLNSWSEVICKFILDFEERPLVEKNIISILQPGPHFFH